MGRCPVCGASLAERRSDAVFCSRVCKVKAARRRRREREVAARDLLLRQSEAVRNGDAAALAQIAEEAELLLNPEG